MKKVLSVALASAMVLGMGANAFAISYSTGSNQEADWPSNFQFDGELFVTDKDGDIIEESTTELNDSESVDFEPGDVIWMPLYADDQYQWKNTWTEGTDGQDAVKSVRLDSSYFYHGETSVDPSVGEVVEIRRDVPFELTSIKEDAADIGEGNDVSLDVATTRITVSSAKYNAADKTVTVRFWINKANYKAIYGEDAPANYDSETISLTVNADDFDNNGTVTGTVHAVVGTYREGATAGSPAVAPELLGVPETVVVVDSDDKEVERTVESAKATINGKTYTIKDMDDGHEVQEFIENVNEQFQKMVDAGKTVTWDDAVVTVNLAEIKATDDVIDKPYIDSADEDKVMADYGHYTGNIDKNWSINLIEKSTGVAELIEKAELYKATATDYASYSKYTDEIMPNAVYLKITLEDTWKTVDSETLTYYVYVADNDSGKQTNEVWVSGKYVNNNWEYVNFDWTNDASKATLWKVEKGENGTAVFDFADKAFFTVKMYSGESMYLDLSTAYDKAIAGEMDAEADSFFKFDNDNANFSRTGELIIVTDDSSLVPYEIDEDGNFVEVDAKYVEDYAIAHTNKKVDGFVFSTKTLGNYVLSTEELGQEEQPAKETPAEPVTPSEPTQETPAPETSKPNPDTGAEDFVGLAVSLAVVSVAAAGALALKK